MAQTVKDRVPVDPEYIQAFGRAMFIFARLEWQAVWCCEKISPGAIQPLSERTAGHVQTPLSKSAQLFRNGSICGSRKAVWKDSARLGRRSPWRFR